MPVRRAEAEAQGFALDLPRGMPGPLAGKASLTFGGIETFIGEISGAEGTAFLQVERALPVFPMTRDMTQLWQPSDDTKAQLMRRVTEETAATDFRAASHARRTWRQVISVNELEPMLLKLAFPS